MEAEQSVLGGLMLDNQAWDAIAEKVNEQDFYRHDHALIFRAIATLSEQDKPYDVVTISDWLEQRNEETFLSTVAVTEKASGDLVCTGLVSYRLLEPR